MTGDYGGPSTFTGSADNGNSVSAKIDTYTVMFNSYIDLGTWAGFTPYVGGGIGKARMEIHDFTTTPAPSVPVSAKYSGTSPGPRWPALPTICRTVC